MLKYLFILVIFATVFGKRIPLTDDFYEQMSRLKMENKVEKPQKQVFADFLKFAFSNLFSPKFKDW